jgi:hypothetical protein
MGMRVYVFCRISVGHRRIDPSLAKPAIVQPCVEHLYDICTGRRCSSSRWVNHLSAFVCSLWGVQPGAEAANRDRNQTDRFRRVVLSKSGSNMACCCLPHAFTGEGCRIIKTPPVAENTRDSYDVCTTLGKSLGAFQMADFLRRMTRRSVIRAVSSPGADHRLLSAVPCPSRVRSSAFFYFALPSILRMCSQSPASTKPA